MDSKTPICWDVVNPSNPKPIYIYIHVYIYMYNYIYSIYSYSVITSTAPPSMRWKRTVNWYATMVHLCPQLHIQVGGYTWIDILVRVGDHMGHFGIWFSVSMPGGDETNV